MYNRNNFLDNLVRNWRTTFAGVGALLIAGGATLAGTPLTEEALVAVITAVGLLFASDAPIDKDCDARRGGKP